VIDVRKLLDVLGAKNIRVEGDVGEIWASCPLGTHTDTDPSFQILNDPTSDSHGYWRCFGCSENGGAVGLVRKVRGVDGKEARRILANLENEVAVGRKLGRAIVTVGAITMGRPSFGEPVGIRRPPFEEWSGPFRDYAAERGITPEQIQRWRIGYSVAGMRLYFPIEDETGRLCSYTARTIVGDRTRYMTPAPRENPISGALFGRRWWPPRGARRLLILAEGAIDALAVERATGAHVGALGGSAITPDQWIHVASWSTVVLMTDPDKAGDRIAEEYRNANPGGDFVRARLPVGCDAQSAGPELVRETLASAGVTSRILLWAIGGEHGPEVRSSRKVVTQ
jgi:DNA primase